MSDHLHPPPSSIPNNSKPLLFDHVSLLSQPTSTRPNSTTTAINRRLSFLPSVSARAAQSSAASLPTSIAPTIHQQVDPPITTQSKTTAHNLNPKHPTTSTTLKPKTSTAPGKINPNTAPTPMNQPSNKPIAKRQRLNPVQNAPITRNARPAINRPPVSAPPRSVPPSSSTTARRIPTSSVKAKLNPVPENHTAKLVSGMESLNENIVENRAKYCEMQQTITALVAQLQAASHANLDKDGKLCEVSRENGVLSTKVIMLEQEIESMRANLNSRESDISRIRSEFIALQEKFEALQIAHSEQLSYNETHFKTELNQVQTQLVETKLDRDRLQADVEVLTIERSNANKEISLLKLTGSQQSSDLSTVQDILIQTQTDLKSTKDALTEKTDRVTQVEEKLRAMETERRKLHNDIQELKGNIRVFCRIRPILPTESSKGDTDQNNMNHIVLEPGSNVVTIKSEIASSLRGTSVNQQAFNFDKIFPPTATQATVFEEISHLVQSALDGYNVSILAYGQTGSGKTFTMEGLTTNNSGMKSYIANERDHGRIEDPYADDDRGMIPRAVDQIFLTAHDLAQHGWHYEFEGQYVEIYNETVQDLLLSNTASSSKTLDVVTDKSTGFPHVPDATSIQLKTPAQVHEMLRRATKNRTVAATLMNDRSSRSHSVFILSISGQNQMTQETCESRLYLVDLAGSERVDKSGAVGERRKEATAINSSLSHLGDVITHLIAKSETTKSAKTGGGSTAHIPYRNSKLTRLLQASLGGNSKTLMFVNISPDFSSCKETISSLRFGAQVNKCQIGTAKKNVNAIS